MKHLLVGLLTCGLLAACGGGETGTPDPGTTSVPPGTGTGNSTATLSGRVILPGAATQALGTQSLTTTAPNWNAPHVRGEVLVLTEGGGAGALPTTLSSLSLQPTGSADVRRVQTPAGESDAAFAARLSTLLNSGLQTQSLNQQSLGRQVTVQPNYLYSALQVPNDPGYPSPNANQGVFIDSRLYDQDYLTRINAQDGWNAIQARGQAPNGTVTAVLDTGVDASHPELQGRLLPGYDFANNDTDPSEVKGGDVGHGTSSVGLIGATTNNGTGIAGLTWGGRTILPLRIFDDSGGATTVTLSRAIDYAAAQGAKVINMSLGLSGVTSDPAVDRSLQAAASAGVVMVASAGNTPGDGLYYPAVNSNVMAVGALGKTDDLACYSARPKSGQKGLDLVAPGGNAVQSGTSCFGDSAYGILSLAPVGQSGSPSGQAQDGYGLRIGTSEAAPLVSGAASLVRGVRPDLGADQVRSVLTSSARTVAGGKLLDVGAAVRAALALPQNTVRQYSVVVSAGGVSKTLSGNVPAGANSVVYTLEKVPTGQQTVTARLTVNGRASSGTLNVNVTGDLNGQDIQTR